jgi:hypothetical protein
VASVLDLLEAKESAARERIEDLREQVLRITAELEEAEAILERLVIARETVTEVLAQPRGESPEEGRAPRSTRRRSTPPRPRSPARTLDIARSEARGSPILVPGRRGTRPCGRFLVPLGVEFAGTGVQYGAVG